VGFISHGGLNSLVESMFHGVPVIGIPVLSEQADHLLRYVLHHHVDDDVASVTKRGAGFELDKRHLSKTSIARSVDKLVEDAAYKANALQFREMLTDVPYTELNNSAFWVEFIMKHQEIPHARSGADDLNVLQYFMLDVIAIVLGGALVIGILLFYCLKFTCQRACGLCIKSKPSVDKEKKRN